MEKKDAGKTMFYCECFFEKCMEWIEFIRYGVMQRDRWISNLCEQYCIYKEYMDKVFVKDFLDERERILKNNHYKMNIEILLEKGEPDIVGKVILSRKGKPIHEATLKAKDCGNGNKLIFWSFEKKDSGAQTTKTRVAKDNLL